MSTNPMCSCPLIFCICLLLFSKNKIKVFNPNMYKYLNIYKHKSTRDFYWFTLNVRTTC